MHLKFALNIPLDAFANYPILARKLRERERELRRAKSRHPPKWSGVVPVPGIQNVYSLNPKFAAFR